MIGTVALHCYDTTVDATVEMARNAKQVATSHDDLFDSFRLSLMFDIDRKERRDRVRPTGRSRLT